MNISIESVEIKGFQSIGEAKINLSNRGIVCIKGINNYEEMAKSNGSGKSSIFESIFYAIYGRTSTGIAYPENRYLKDGCCVKLILYIDGVKYTIIRTNKGRISTVKLYREDEDISGRNKTDTEDIIKNDIVKVSQDIFLSTVFLSQGFSGKLSSLSPSGRKERIESLTDNSEDIDKFRDKVQNIKNSYTEKYNSISSDISFKQGTYYQLQKENEGLEKSIAEINEIKPDYKLEDIESEITNVKQLNEILENKLEKRRDTLNEYTKKKVLINSEVNNLEKEKKNLNSEIIKLQSSDICPTCGRKYEGVNEERIKQSIREKEERIKEICNKIEDIKNNEAIKVYNEEKKIIDAKNSVEELIRDNNSKLSELEVKKEELLKIADTKQYEEKLRDNKVKLQDITEEIRKLNEESSKYKELSEVANHCTTLIARQFRNYLLGNAIDFMNSRLSNYSKMLFSNPDDCISLVRDSTKLDIFLGDAPYESLSGGEKRKVDIALILAQKDLAMNVSGLNCNLLILDEIFESLDDEAIMTVTEVLTSVSSEIDSMFVISHKDTDIGYDSMITVIKDKNRISRVVDN